MILNAFVLTIEGVFEIEEGTTEQSTINKVTKYVKVKYRCWPEGEALGIP